MYTVYCTHNLYSNCIINQHIQIVIDRNKNIKEYKYKNII